MKRNKEINNVDDYNDYVCELLDEWVTDFVFTDGLTREPTEEDFDDFGHEDIGFMYTQKGMNLYERACTRFYELGKLKFPHNIEDLNIEARGMLYP